MGCRSSTSYNELTKRIGQHSRQLCLSECHNTNRVAEAQSGVMNSHEEYDIVQVFLFVKVNVIQNGFAAVHPGAMYIFTKRL